MSESEATTQQRYSQLAAQPLCELAGVVSARGSGGGMSGGDELWSFTFTLEAWRIGDGAINDFDLIVRRLVTEDELDALRDRVTRTRLLDFEHVSLWKTLLADFWANSDEWNRRILDCIARDCLPLKNENWQEDDGSLYPASSLRRE